MATTYTSTITAKCRKEHTCIACGGIYSYPLVRKVKATASTAEKAALAAQNNVARTLKREVDAHPCPTCGLYQHDMIGQQRRKRHKVILWIGILAFVILIALRLSYLMHANELTWLIGLACVVVLTAHSFVDSQNPNADLSKNLAVAGQRVSEGTIRHAAVRTMGSSSMAVDERARPAKGLGQRMALPMLLVGAGLAFSPELMRGMSHWPLNPDCYPPVVGAGDQTRIYMRDKISSIQGYWRGTPSVRLKTQEGKTIDGVSATTNQNTWGSSISAKSSEKNNNSTPWVELTFPDAQTADLSGQTVECAIDLHVSYPEAFAEDKFQTTQSLISRSVSLQMAPAGAGTRYNGWWWQGTVLGIGLCATAGILLITAARALQRSATPTRIYSD